MSWFSIVAIIGAIWFMTSLAMGMFVGKMIKIGGRMEPRDIRTEEDLIACYVSKGETVSA